MEHITISSQSRPIMLLGRYLWRSRLYRHYVYSWVFVFVMRVLDGWLGRIIGRKLRRFCLLYQSRSFFDGKDCGLMVDSLPPDHPYVQMELDEVSTPTFLFDAN